MALGTNLNFKPDHNILWALFRKLMLQKRVGGKHHTKRKFICTKAGAPATNTAADDPGQAGVVCLDLTNSRVYVCSAYTNSTTFTWTRIV